jgi:preprotein translocase subunit SecF
MEFFKSQTHIHFMAMKKYTTGIALLLCITSLALLGIKGLNYGLEFTGGTQVELRFQAPIEAQEVQKTLQDAGLHATRAQHYGSTQDIILRLSDNNHSAESKTRTAINAAFSQKQQPVEIRRIEFVGSEVGQQLAEQGGIAVIVAILATMIYIALRFEYKFAISAALGLAHDALIVLGVFVLFQIEFDLAALAAVLAVVGYSLNDKIVVFDRVRENFRMMRQGTPEEVMDGALNQTLSRTIMTSFMTMLVVLALLIFGGESLFSFSLALCIGIAVGTYSSIFVASAMAIIFGLSRNDLLPKPKVVVDNRP